MYEELIRGATGTMTGFAYPEVLIAVYRHIVRGEREQAADVFFRALPLIRYEHQPGIGLSLRKETLKRRGLIADARVRHPGASIDQVTRAELFALIDRVQPEVMR